MQKENLNPNIRYQFYKRGNYAEAIINMINFLRTDPSGFEEIFQQIPDKARSILKFMAPTSPLIYNSNLGQCGDELMNYLILTDKGEKNLNITNNYYKYQSRLGRYGFFTGNYSEIVLYNKYTINDVVMALLSNDKYRNDITNSFLNFISVSIDTLPSDSLCIIIDLIHDYKSTGDLVQKTVYSSNINPNDIETKSFVVYTTNNHESSLVKDSVCTTIPNEQKNSLLASNSGVKNYIRVIEEGEKVIKEMVYPYKKDFNSKDKNLIKEDFSEGYEVLVLTKDLRKRNRSLRCCRYKKLK